MWPRRPGVVTGNDPAALACFTRSAVRRSGILTLLSGVLLGAGNCEGSDSRLQVARVRRYDGGFSDVL
jgi:hypothetical protein